MRAMIDGPAQGAGKAINDGPSCAQCLPFDSSREILSFFVSENAVSELETLETHWA